MESKSPDDLAQFYEKVLELPVHSKPGESEIIIGSSRMKFRQAPPGQSPFYHFAINIPANKIHEAKDWLSLRVQLIWIADYASDIADFRGWNAKSIYFFDPVGNVVELIARFDLKNEVAEHFSSKQFLSLGEIGLVYPKEDIEKNTEALLRRTGLTYFSKQAPFPQFKAVGDDEGLFIVVTEGRNWYPTDKPAGRFHLRVKFEVEGRVYEESI